MKRVRLILILLLAAVNLWPQAQDRLKYEVSVEVQVIPLFALDSRGLPVYDLAKEDLRLFINGKAVPTAAFNRYNLEQIEEKVRTPHRYVFIIIDSIFNSTAGLKRSREIAAGFVDNSPPSDAFIVLECNPGGGLKYVIGPAKNRKRIKKAIQKIKQLPEYRKKVQDSQSFGHFLPAEEGMVGHLNRSFNEEQKRKDRESEQFRYKADLKYFARVLAEFRYALKAITQPKIVFLISEGVSKGAFKEVWLPDKGAGSNGLSKGAAFYELTATTYENHHIYYEYLKQVARAVNEGGGALYTINPRKIEADDDHDTSGRESLKYMAEEGGGQYFAGLDTQKVVQRIKRSTTAYYELFFYPPGTDQKESLRLRIECGRAGVRIHTVQFTAKKVLYRQMPPFQKKLFALNVANSGMWSRVTGAIDRLSYGKLGQSTGKGKTYRHLEVVIPPEMRDRPLDIFTLQVDPVSQNAGIAFKSRTVSSGIKITLPLEQSQKQYIVIIDPATTRCLYSLIR